MPIHNRDYILRLIEQLGAMLARLTGQLREDPVDESTDLAEMDAALDEIARRAGLDLGLASRLSTESLMILIAPGDEIDPSRCWLLAELLYLRGTWHERNGDEAAAFAASSRALHLFRMVRPEWSTEISLPDPATRIAALERGLQEEERLWND